MKNKIGIIRKFFASIILLLVLVFFCACGLYFFEKNGQPETFGSISDAMWFVFLTLTTIGYSDLTPWTFGGKLITIFTAVIGSLIGVACFIGIVLGTLKLGTFLRKTRVRILNR
ncbi:MAG: potassium channel family protein [Candidatus Poribacteria bacterium]|nr:potassium channel family protein [Candidatus Poribacteria bacterium]